MSYFNKNVSISVYLWISFCKYILQPVDIVKRVKRKQRIRKDFLMFYQIFLSPKVKRCTIITYKYGIYELPQELPNDLRLENMKISKMKILSILAKNS